MHGFKEDLGVSGGAHGERKVLPALAAAWVGLGHVVQTWGILVLSWPGAMQGAGPSLVHPNSPGSRDCLTMHPFADLQEEQGRFSPS